jgi:hypothetical protein
MSIEAAAREIAGLVNDVAAMPLKDDHWKQYAEIIARHLFPLVKPEDCDKDRLYYFRCDANEWFIDNGDWAKRLCDV